MNVESARSTLIRKFTNHRNHDVGAEKSNTVKMYTALREAAAALVDFKAFSKGKALFKRQRMDAIMARRNEIYKEYLADEHELPLIAAFQKALKELWNGTDQDQWETQAADEPEDIHA